MQLYLDTSALTKLVVVEPETIALQGFLTRHNDDTMFVSALARTELIRSVVRRGMLDAVPHARRLMSRLDTVPLTARPLDEAAMLPPPDLRTLDALHLSAACTAPALRALITYDLRVAKAAEAVGIPVASPA